MGGFEFGGYGMRLSINILDDGTSTCSLAVVPAEPSKPFGTNFNALETGGGSSSSSTSKEDWEYLRS